MPRISCPVRVFTSDGVEWSLTASAKVTDQGELGHYALGKRYDVDLLSLETEEGWYFPIDSLSADEVDTVIDQIVDFYRQWGADQ